MADKSERTEAPTERRLRKAREEGQFPAAREFVLREFGGDYAELDLPAGIDNPKGELQELLQARSPIPPVYQLVSAVGPDHDRNFVCAVLHEGSELAQGSGKSKKAAESAAAFAALRKLLPPREAPAAVPEPAQTDSSTAGR